MPYLDINDFRSGLDARKYRLALPAGTLTQLTNAHINQGGEVEKRKAFITTALPPGTFWGQEDSTGITVFGSRAISWANVTLTRTGGFVNGPITLDPSGYGMIVGGTVTISNATDATFNGTVVNSGGSANFLIGAQAGADASAVGTITLIFPSPVQYLRLQHPDGVTQMTGIVTTCQFGAGIFSAAMFADGNKLYYFNETLISDFDAGLIWSGSPNGFTLAQNLVDLINASGMYTATAPALPGYLTFGIAGGSTSTPAVAATGIFSVTSTPSVNDQVVLGSQVYTFVAALNNAIANQILRQGSSAQSITNLFNAIGTVSGLGSGSGTLYSSATVANPDARVSNLNTTASPRTFIATALVAGTAGNSLATTTTSSNASWNTPTLTGGVALVSGAGDVTAIFYNFSSTVQLTPNFSTNSALIVQSSIGLGPNATGVLTLGLLPNDGDQVVVGAKTYVFKNVINNGTANQVLIDGGGDVNQTLWNLADAVVLNLATKGTGYSNATTVNLQAIAADASLPVNGQLLFTAITAGATSVASTTNVVGASWSCGATLRYNANLTALAASIAVAINNATDAYGGGEGTNLGFSATSSGTVVTVIPPVQQQPADTLTVDVANSLTVTIPTVPFVFNINSIPNLNDGTPYQVSVTTDSALGVVTLTLQNTGIPVVPAVNPSTSFSIIAGANNTAATGTLTNSNTNPNVAETITIASTVYKFVLAFSGAPNEILIQSTPDATMNALIAAINNQTGIGTTYSVGTLKNTDVVAGTLSSHAFTVTALTGGNIGNSIITLSTAASTTWGAATLTGGDAVDTNQITQIAIGATNLLAAHVQFNKSTTQTAVDVVNAINSQSSITGFTAKSAANLITITSSVSGTALNGTTVTVTTGGEVCVYQCFFSVGSATGLAAGQNISQIAAGATNLMTGTITWNGTDTVAQFCAKVVANIAANSGVSGWTAVSVANVIYLSKSIAASTDALPTVTVTATATINYGPTTTTALALTAPSVTLAIALAHSSNKGIERYFGSVAIQLTTTGGLGPYVYNWTRTSGGGVSVSNAKIPNPIFSAGGTGIAGTVSQPSGAAVYRCTVTDSVGSTATIDITISF